VLGSGGKGVQAMLIEPNRRCKPILKWAGGKSALLPQFSRHFPLDCRRYIEPFLGGGAVFFSLADIVPSIVNDGNPEIINLYKVLRDEKSSLTQRLDTLATFYSEEFFYELRSYTPDHSVDRAARTVFLNKTGFNGLYRQNSKGHFNVPFGKRNDCPALYDLENLNAASEKLKCTEIFCLDFEKIIDMAGAGDFVYCDPPYEPLSKTSSFNAYQGKGFTRTDQVRLKEACLRAESRGAKVAISNSVSPFILELYSDCQVANISARRAINSKGGSRGVVSEVLVKLGYGHQSAEEDKLPLKETQNDPTYASGRNKIVATGCPSHGKF
jgi:DNA adenine methylase